MTTIDPSHPAATGLLRPTRPHTGVDRPRSAGGVDEILVTFVIPGHQFHDHLGRIPDGGDPVETQALTAREAAAMRMQCRTRSTHRRLIPAWQ